MGFSASDMAEPYIHTNKSVRNLSSNLVWIISGEGGSPKDFYLAGVFRVKRVAADTYDHPGFKNSAYGDGHIIGETILLNGEAWFESLKASLGNFRNGLSEITDPDVISSIRSEAGLYAL